jgi:hypothetical protein
VEKHLIEFYQLRIIGVRRDLRHRYGHSKAAWSKMKGLLRTRQQDLCYYCGGELEPEDENVGHIISVKHCALAAHSDKEANTLANDLANLALVHGDPCNSWVGYEDMTCGIEGDLESILAAMRKFNRGE